ncbi:glycosyltransferase [Vibrio sinensis]|uniref:glycosyltransferase n=1 Tax=Vibrio sinensis TaxID=2302434 RepID=UPI0014041477|nr:glycosyltransferase [Vibrio sinensis]
MSNIVNYAFLLEEFPYPRDRSGVSLYDYEMLINAPVNANIDVYILFGERDVSYENALRQDINCSVTFFYLAKKKSRILFFSSVLIRSLLGLVGSSRDVGFKVPMLKEKEYKSLYSSPMLSQFSFGHGYPVLLNAVDSFSKYNYRLYRENKKTSALCKYKIYSFYEKHLLNIASKVSFVSCEDADFVKNNLKNKGNCNIIVSPLGVDKEAFRYVGLDNGRNKFSILFLGNFNYYPNVDAARYLALEVFPKIKEKISDATLVIVGNNPPLDICGLPDVECTGYVEDVKDYYWSSSIFICPLRLGAGTKNKILEAMASGLPIISTRVGVEGIPNIEHKIHFVEANTLEDIVDSAIDVMNDSRLASKLSKNAISLINGNFSWKAIIDNAFQVLNRLD